MSSDDELHNGWLQRAKKALSFGAQSAAATSGSVSQRVLVDLRTVHETLAREEALAAERKFDNRQKGRRLLFLFQRDLLPGVSGMILESKGQRDNISAPQVSREAKIAAWTFLTAANVGMLFYILLFALSQTTHRQSAWAMSFVLWLVVEILLVSSATVVFTHILVPSLIMQDVKKIKMKLVESIRAFNHNVKNRTIFDDDAEVGENGGTGGANFNAANYLFTSTRLAKKWHELREAQIIAQFRTPWPKQSYMRESSVSKSYSKKYTALTRSASIVAIFFFTQLLQVPPGLQDMVVQMVATASIGYTVLLHVNLFHIFPLLAFVPLLLIIVIVHFVLQSGKGTAQQELNKMLPPPAPKKEGSPKLALITPAAASSMDQGDIVEAKQTIWQHVSGSFDAVEAAVEIQDDRDFDPSEEDDFGALNMPRTPPLTPGGHLMLDQPKGHANRKQSVRMGLQVLRALQAQHGNGGEHKHSHLSSDDGGSGDSDSDDEYGVQVRVPGKKQQKQAESSSYLASSSSGEYVDISELHDDTVLYKNYEDLQKRTEVQEIDHNEGQESESGSESEEEQTADQDMHKADESVNDNKSDEEEIDDDASSSADDHSVSDEHEYELSSESARAQSAAALSPAVQTAATNPLLWRETVTHKHDSAHNAITRTEGSSEIGASETAGSAGLSMDDTLDSHIENHDKNTKTNTNSQLDESNDSPSEYEYDDEDDNIDMNDHESHERESEDEESGLFSVSDETGSEKLV